jgi:hypothetical protein
VRNGYLMVYPKREDVVFHTGYDLMKAYRFATKQAEHKFCPTCGSSIFAEGHWDFLAVNVTTQFMIYNFNALMILLGSHVSGR